MTKEHAAAAILKHVQRNTGNGEDVNILAISAGGIAARFPDLTEETVSAAMKQLVDEEGNLERRRVELEVFLPATDRGERAKALLVHAGATAPSSLFYVFLPLLSLFLVLQAGFEFGPSAAGIGPSRDSFDKGMADGIVYAGLAALFGGAILRWTGRQLFYFRTIHAEAYRRLAQVAYPGIGSSTAVVMAYYLLAPSAGLRFDASVATALVPVIFGAVYGFFKVRDDAPKQMPSRSSRKPS